MQLQTFLEQLKSKLSIIDVISKYITLTKKGNRHWGCCPFHHEKTPSFAVDEYSGFFYCFGCKEHGDMVRFIQNIEGTDFLGALRILSNMAGMPMPDLSNGKDKDTEKLKKQRDRLFSLLKTSAIYYNSNLRQNKDSSAYQYLINRGISETTMTKFGLGLSLGWDQSIKYLKSQGYTDEELLSSGMAGKRDDGSIYDAYAGRIIYPIIDSYNQVVAFGGRTMDKSAYAKYKNTSDTPVFNKKKVLYGLNLVKKEKIKYNISSIIVVEGYMDAISVYEAGFKNVVASMGTAFTKEQAKLTKYVADEVLMCYDGDSAGIKGICLALDILEEAEIPAKVIVMPNGIDPDELIKQEGERAFENAVNEAVSGVEFKLSLIRQKHPFSDKSQQSKFIHAYLRVIASIKSNTEQAIYLDKMAKECGVNVDVLKSDLKTIKLGEKPKLIYTQVEKKVTTSLSTKAMRFIIYYVIMHKDKLKYLKEISSCIEDGVQKEIYTLLNKNKELSANGLNDLLNDEGKDELGYILGITVEDKIEEDAEEKYFFDCLSKFEKEMTEQKREQLTLDYSKETDPQKKNQILIELSLLSKPSKR